MLPKIIKDWFGLFDFNSTAKPLSKAFEDWDEFRVMNRPNLCHVDFNNLSTPGYTEFNHKEPMHFTSAQRQQLQSYLSTLITELTEEREYLFDYAKRNASAAKASEDTDTIDYFKSCSKASFIEADRKNKKLKNLAKLQAVVKNLYTEG